MGAPLHHERTEREKNDAANMARVLVDFAKGKDIERRPRVNIEGVAVKWKPYHLAPLDWVSWEYRTAQSHKDRV